VTSAASNRHRDALARAHTLHFRVLRLLKQIVMTRYCPVPCETDTVVMALLSGDY
jgi:hypothetical protein